MNVLQYLESLNSSFLNPSLDPVHIFPTPNNSQNCLNIRPKLLPFFAQTNIPPPPGGGGNLPTRMDYKAC